MMDAEGRYKAKQAMNLQRWADAESGTTAHTAAEEHLPPPASHNAQTPKFVREYADYYKDPPRLPSPFGELQHRLVQNYAAGLHQHAVAAACG